MKIDYSEACAVMSMLFGIMTFISMFFIKDITITILFAFIAWLFYSVVYFIDLRRLHQMKKQGQVSRNN